MSDTTGSPADTDGETARLLDIADALDSYARDEGGLAQSTRDGISSDADFLRDVAASLPHPVSGEPRKGDLLDDATEEAIAAFGAAKWKHGRNGPATDGIGGEIERTANQLRARIRELGNG